MCTAGGSGSREQRAAAGTRENEAPKPITGAGADTAAAGVDPNVYTIGGQDVLFIKVWRETDFTGSYVVRPDGKITIPLVGDVQAAGLTPVRLWPTS